MGHQGDGRGSREFGVGLDWRFNYKVIYRSRNDIVDSLIGIIPDKGKILEEYKEERISEKYGIDD